MKNWSIYWMSKVIPINKFKKQYKKVKKNPRWNNIFNGKVPFKNDNRSPWRYIIDCFLADEKIPDYFYEHPITLSQNQKKQIKARLNSSAKAVSILALDLHFDGHNGDHLLLYVKTKQNVIYLVGIGTHSELF